MAEMKIKKGNPDYAALAQKLETMPKHEEQIDYAAEASEFAGMMEEEVFNHPLADVASDAYDRILAEPECVVATLIGVRDQIHRHLLYVIEHYGRAQMCNFYRLRILEAVAIDEPEHYGMAIGAAFKDYLHIQRRSLNVYSFDGIEEAINDIATKVNDAVGELDEEDQELAAPKIHEINAWINILMRALETVYSNIEDPDALAPEYLDQPDDVEIWEDYLQVLTSVILPDGLDIANALWMFNNSTKEIRQKYGDKLTPYVNSAIDWLIQNGHLKDDEIDLDAEEEDLETDPVDV